MYCKNCGKELQVGDKFCSECGTKVANLVEAEPEFNPMFKREAQNLEEKLEERPKRNFHIEDFNWDLDGYPTTQKKKTEEIEFNWESVLDERDRRTREERVPLFTGEEIPKKPSEKTPQEIISTLPIEEEKEIDLMKELEKDASASEEDLEKTVRIDKFYTFNKKNAEFQALLDKEYERLKNGKASEEKPLEEESKQEDIDAFKMREEPSEEEEGKLTVEGILGVKLADTPETVIAYEEEQPKEVEPLEEKPLEEEAKEEEKITEETEEKEPEEKEEKEPEEASVDPVGEKIETKVETETRPPSEEEKKEGEEDEHKLTFDDIFADDDDDSEGAPKKKHTVLRVIAVILCILVVLELIAIAVTYFAPDSVVAEKIISIFNSVSSMFTGSTPKG